jgi:hypothetical protein
MIVASQKMIAFSARSQKITKNLIKKHKKKSLKSIKNLLKTRKKSTIFWDIPARFF